MRRVVKSAPPPGGDRREFVMSDDSVDRMGDVIEPAGWDLSSFQAGAKFNPIALFNHKPDQVVGSWSHVRVADGRLIGKFEPLEPGTSELADSVRKMVEQNVLRAVSVGFDPIEKELLHEKAHPHSGPFRFKRQALLECSIVSVPANANAVAIAKSLNISHETMSRVFGEQAEARRGDVTALGEHAVIKSAIERPVAMTTLSERIEHTQTELNSRRDRLDELNNAANFDTEAVERVIGEIDTIERDLSAMKSAEARTAART
jgi:HK97 family phage prohead protease